MPNTRRLICHRKLLQITAGEIRRFSMRGLPVNRGSYLASIVIDLHTTLYIVWTTSSCQRGMNSSLFCYSRHALSAMYPGVKVCRLTERRNTPGNPFFNKCLVLKLFTNTCTGKDSTKSYCLWLRLYTLKFNDKKNKRIWRNRKL
jgi:hypothetical protein